MASWDEIKKVVREGYGKAAARTGEYTRIGKIKLEISGINRKIKKAHTRLGSRTFNLVKRGLSKKIDGDEAVLTLVKEITGLNSELKVQEKKLKAAPAEK